MQKCDDQSLPVTAIIGGGTVGGRMGLGPPTFVSGGPGPPRFWLNIVTQLVLGPVIK